MASSQVITRGNLPHWYVPGAAHFVTYRLADTLPAAVLHALREKKAMLLNRTLAAGETEAERRVQTHKILFGDYDRYLDQNREIDWLKRPAVAAMVRRNLYHHNGGKYKLLAYCVMPNHVHVLLRPIVDAAASGGAMEIAVGGLQADADSAAGSGGYENDESVGEQLDNRSPLASIMHSLKSYTANEANKLLGRSGRFWQKESYDHWVRDDEELERIVAYIIANPVKAGLVELPHDWFFGSALDRYLHDGVTTGYLGDL